MRKRGDNMTFRGLVGCSHLQMIYKMVALKFNSKSLGKYFEEVHNFVESPQEV